MPTQAFLGVETVLEYGDGASPEVYTPVSSILSITGPQLGGERVDVTSLDSPNGFREYIQGLKTGGNIPFSINFNPGAHTDQQQLFSDHTAGTVRNWQIRWPDANNIWVRFAAFVESVGPITTEPGSQVRADVSLTMTGQPTWSWEV